jgi:ABC-type nitrate/sulfonate/bicarbonate transport system permease component
MSTVAHRNVRRLLLSGPGRPLVGAALPLALLILWEALGRADLLPAYLVEPSAILRAMWATAADGELFSNIGASMFRAGMGFLIGSASGLMIGLAAGVLPRVEQFYGPIISLTYPVPKTAILPIAFAWFGLGDASKIIVISASVFYPSYLAAFYGAQAVNKVHIWSALNMGASRAEVFLRIVVPSALPQIFNGLRIGLGLSFVVMVVSELITARSGLGYMIGMAEYNSRFDLMFVAIITIGIIGFSADRLLVAVRRRVLVGQLIGKDMGRG